jgi:uncharacterized cupredoxin-like copper-binding protein
MNAVAKLFRRAMLVSFVCGGLLALGSCVPIAGTRVDVEVRSFTVTPNPTSAPAGSITFRVRNTGTENHEFLVIKTDLPDDALPTEANGSYQENGPGTEIIDEIEAIPPGATRNLTLDLETGKYVLICNLVEVEDGEIEAHYAEGMHAAFTVE